MSGRQARDGAIINPSFAYGFSTNIHGNVYHLEGQKLLYPAGQFFAVMGTEDGKASFIATNSAVRAVRGLKLSGNKKYLAAVEQIYDDDQQQVSVYGVPAEKHLRTLTLDRQHTHASTVAALSFSGDAKLLLVAGGEPDYTVMLWRWYSSKLVMSISPELQVCCATLNPWDDSLLALAGPHLARSYRLDVVAATAKPNNHLMLDHSGSAVITCMVYLVGGMLAIGISTGRIMVYSEAGMVSSMDINASGDQQATGNSSSSNGSNQQRPMSASKAGAAAGGSRPESRVGSAQQKIPTPEHANGVQALVQRGRGFVVAGSNWDVYLFDPPAATSKRSNSPDAFTISRVFSYASAVACSSLKTSLASTISSSSRLVPEAHVLGLSVSITDDHIALSTAAGKLLLLDLTATAAAMDEAAEATAAAAAASTAYSSNEAGSPASADAAPAPSAHAGNFEGVDPADPNPTGWQVLCAGFPSARVVGLDACQHLPLLLVVSEDRWARVWDWVRRARVAGRYLADEQPLCCALHPSGFMAALGSSEGLRLYYILRRELLPMADLPVAKCSVARYSHGGALLAAVGRSNAIVVYPAYYGGGAGASGSTPLLGGSSAHYTQRSVSGDKTEGVSAAAAAAAGGIGSEGACLMRPLFVLKAHVSTVTDLVFSGDDQRLISSGAGGAVYFWDMSTGSRLMELEYVDKQCVYYSACFHDRHAAAIVRTIDGRIQHIKDGHLSYELTGLGTDASPMAITGDGRVILACTSRGSIVSIGWPKDPEAAAQPQKQRYEQQHLSMGGCAGLQQPHQQLLRHSAIQADADDASASAVGVHAGLMKHLSVQVGAGALASPRGSVATPGSAATSAARTPASTLAVKTPHTSTTPHGGSGFAVRTPSGAQPSESPIVCNSNSSSPSRLQQQRPQQLQQRELADVSGTPGDVLAAPGSPGPRSAGPHSPGPRSPGTDRHGDSAAGAASHKSGNAMKEYRLHSARITAIKVLHSSGVVFTASVDGLVMMSTLSLVVDGILTEPPPLALPPSATAAGSTAAAAAAAGFGSAALPGGADSATATLTAGLTAASLGAANTPGAVPGFPLPVVLVDEGLVQIYKERLKSMAAQVTAIQKEAQYQVLRQTQALKESLGISDSQAAVLAREVEELKATLAETKAAADADQQQIAKELETLHAAAAEQLEGLYEARLALEGERLAQLAAAKDDMEFSLKEELKRQATAAERDLTEVHNMYRQQLAAEAAQAEAAAAAAAETAAVWQEVLLQTEEDLEQQAERDGDRLAAAKHEAGEVETKLKAEINILLRSAARLKADKATDASKIDALAREVAGFKQQLAEAATVTDKLRGEVLERDAVIGDSYATLQGLRRRVQELETHKFVLGYKAEAAASELQPKDEQLAQMHETLDAQGRELLAGRSALWAAQRAVSEKNVAVAASKQELWDAKQTLTKQEALLDAVAHDIFQVLQQPDERRAGGKTARQQALENLAVKYCTNRGAGPRSSVQVEAEMLAHIATAEKKSKLLERQLKNARASNLRVGRRLMADNASLLQDLADLQHSNRDLARQLAAATNQLANFGVQFSSSNIASSLTASTDAAADSTSPRAAADSSSSSCQLQQKAAVVAVAQSRPVSAAAGGYVPAFLTAGGSRPTSPGRQQGSAAAGRLVPASTSRVLNAALQQQQQQLAELQSLLSTTASVVATQAAQIARLQDNVSAGAAAATAGQQPQQLGRNVTDREQPVRSGSPLINRSNDISSAVHSHRLGANHSDSIELGSPVAGYIQGLPLAYELQDELIHSAHVPVASGGSASSVSSLTSGSKLLTSNPVTQQHAGSGWRLDSAVARAAAAQSGSRPVPCSPCSQSLRSSWRSSPSGSKGLGSAAAEACSGGSSTGRPGSTGHDRPGSTGRVRPSTASAAIRPSGRMDVPHGAEQQQQQQQHAGVTAGRGAHAGALTLRGDVGLTRSTPPANVPKKRPTTAGGVGMLACLKSDLEAWRSK